MEWGPYFLVALILSFLGSIPIGLITLTITQKTIQNGRQSGIMVALGASVMEFFYTYVALISLDFFTRNTVIGDYIKIFATIIFLGMGLFHLLKKNNKIESPSSYNYFDFGRGVIIGAMNMLIVPFWIFLGIWLEANGFIFDQQIIIITFCVGATFGAMIAFWGYIWLSEYIVTKIKEINKYTNKVIGIMFLGLAILQVIQLI